MTACRERRAKSKSTPSLKRSASPKKTKNSFSESSPPRKTFKPNSSSKSQPKRTLFHYFSPSKSVKSTPKNTTHRKVSESPRSTLRSGSMGSTPSSSPTSTSTSESIVDEHETEIVNLFDSTNSSDKNRMSLAPLNSNVLANAQRSKASSDQASTKKPVKNDLNGLSACAKTITTLTSRKRHSDESFSVALESQGDEADSKRFKIFKYESDTIEQGPKPQTPTKKPESTPGVKDVPFTPTTQTTALPTNDTATESTTPSNNKQEQSNLSIGLIRVKSSKATIKELCTCVYENFDHSNVNENQSKPNSIPSIYRLFEGAILGRNERSKKDPSKVNIGIPTSENGVSRKQLSTHILQPDPPKDLELPKILGRDVLSSTCEISLQNYLNYQQKTCPCLKVTCAKNAMNPIVVVKAIVNHESSVSNGNNVVPNNRVFVTPGNCVKLRVGDAIEFDAYQKHGQTKKTRFVYRVVVFNHSQCDFYKTAAKQPLERRQPSRRAKEMLDKTVDKDFEDDIKNNKPTTPKNEICEEEVKNTESKNPMETVSSDGCSEMVEIIGDEPSTQPADVDDDNVQNYLTDKKLKNEIAISEKKSPAHHDNSDDAHLFPELNDYNPEKSFDISSVADPDGDANRNNNSHMNDDEEQAILEDDDINFSQDDEINYSQDSFMGTAFESLIQKSTNDKLVEIAPIMSNFLWRDLNSTQPQNGFGFLIHACNAFHTVPNLSLSRQITEFILRGPMSSDGTYHTDYNRTELVAIYVDSINKKIMQSDSKINSRVKFNVAPLNWNDFEEILKLPMRETPTNSHNLGLTMHLSSTSLRLIALSLETVLKSAIQSDDKSLYSNHNLVETLISQGLRSCLKETARLFAKCMVKHGHWILGDSAEGYKSCETSNESLCVLEFKSCLSSYGSIICQLAWLFCMEESLDFAHEECCFIIKDAILNELEKINFGVYTCSCKRVNAATKKRIKKSIKLQLILSLDNDFSEPLQLSLGTMLEVSKDLSIIL